MQDEKLLLKYRVIWKIIRNILKREKIDSETVFNDQYLKTQIKSYNNKSTTIVKNIYNYNNEMPKEGVACICLVAIVIDSIFNSGKHYFPQALLEKCR